MKNFTGFLSESKEILDIIFGSLDEAVFISTPGDSNGFVYVSPSAGRIWGKKKITHDFLSGCVHPGDRELVDKSYRKFAQSDREYTVEYRIISHDNKKKWIFEKGHLLRDHDKNIIAYIRVSRDITAEKQSEGKFKNMAKVFMESADPIIIEDLDGNIIDMNDEAVRAYGWEREDLLGKTIKTIIPTKRHAQTDELLCQCIEEADVKNVESLRLSRDNKIIPVLLSFSLLRDENENPAAVATISKDITDVIEARKLQKEIIKISETERQNVGQVLHDELGQILTGVSYITESIKEKIENSLPVDINDINTVSGLITKAVNQTRNLSRGLNPVYIKEGLRISLEELANESEKLYGISCNTVIEGDAYIDDPVTATHLYYITKESINNAIKHSRARNIELFLFSNESGFLLRIQNDIHDSGGKKPHKDRGLGLRIMKYRAGIIDADFSIEGDDAGFVVTVRKRNFQENI